jgi:calcium-dependent protein kinase
MLKLDVDVSIFQDDRPEDLIQFRDGRGEQITRGVPKHAVIHRHTNAKFVRKHYTTERKLGEGSFGQVNLVKDGRTDQRRVCKTISTQDMSSDTLAMMRAEIEVLSLLDHPNVVKLFEFADDEAQGQFVLIMEYLPGGDCLDLLLRASNSGTGILKEEVVGKIANHLLLALCYCHSQGIVHRDVKPENMMLTARDGQLDCKIIDFGLAVRKKRLDNICGTPSYIAPEVIGGLGYDSKVDIWASGITVLELLTGVKFFGCPEDDSEGALKQVIVAIRNFRDFKRQEIGKLGGLPGWPRSKPAMEFVKRCLCVDPKQRPSAAQALSTPWIADHKDAPTAMTAEMIKSLVSYNEAPPIMRCCLYIIAARQGIPEFADFGAAFKSIDVDGDGKISAQDLASAVKGTTNWWEQGVDVNGVLEAADLDHTGGLNFTQFVAACLFAQNKKEGSLDDLKRRAFEALDEDRDGSVQVEDIWTLFRERDAPLLMQLPQDRPFNMTEWMQCLNNVQRASVGGKSVLPAFPTLDSLIDRFIAGAMPSTCRAPGYPPPHPANMIL